MPDQTYAIASSRDFRAGAQEMPFNNVAGHPYLQDQGAALAIYNRNGSGKILTVTDFFVRDLATPNSIAASVFILQKVTGWVLGGAEEKDMSGGYLAKLDSNNSDLPSQVKFYEDVLSATTSGGIFRVMNNLPFYNEIRACAEMCAYLHADNDSCLNNAALYRAHDHSGGTQSIIVREGEGFIISPLSGLVQYTIKYALNFFIRDTSNSQCYVCNVGLTPDGGRVSFLFANGAGSGKTYEIYAVEMAETGNDIFPNLFSLEKIEGLDANSGVISDISSYDSANESLTGKIDYRRDCNVTIYGLSQGAIMASPRLFRDWQTSVGTAPYLNGSMTLPLGGFNANFGDIRKESSQIILREGEGVAVFKRTMSGIGKSGLFLRFTVKNSTTQQAAGITNLAYIG